jgi:hypothetical protein
MFSLSAWTRVMPHRPNLPAAALGALRAPGCQRALGWLLAGVLLIHALVLPQVAVASLSRMPTSRETEHEVRVETEWRGASEEEEQAATGSRRSVSCWDIAAARRPLGKSGPQVAGQTMLFAERAELRYRNGLGGPLRC